MHIGAKRGEGREVYQSGKPILCRVKLVVAQYRGVEAHLVHQHHHRVGRNLVHIVQGVARTVIACRENQQVGIECTQRVGDKAKTWEALDSSMHIVA